MAIAMVNLNIKISGISAIDNLNEETNAEANKDPRGLCQYKWLSHVIHIQPEFEPVNLLDQTTNF
jgi:hypothetical protein